MLPTPQPALNSVHRLARFVTLEAIALHLNILPKQIRRIDCWKYVIHVVGEGISKFVSYADLPPILKVEPPTKVDFHYWRKRCKVRKQKHSPSFWLQFYAAKFSATRSDDELYRWGNLVGMIKLLLPDVVLQWLRGVYKAVQCAIAY